MKQTPRVGETGEREFVVQPEHVIKLAPSGMPEVLSTPWLIWFLEHAAREAVQCVLQPDEATVGVHVDVRHLAPTPMGQKVTCRARIIHVEGPVISFQLEARDQHELIARGHHKRRVIRLDRFAALVQRKT